MGEAEGQLEKTEDAAIEETSTTNETDLEEVKQESSEVGSECLSDSMTSQPPDTSTALDVKEDTEKQNTATDEKLFEGTHQSKIRKKIKIKVTVTESSEQGCPCSAPVASSQALSVHPPECPTSATSPLITENLSGVPQSTPQLSEPCEEAESTEEEGNNT